MTMAPYLPQSNDAASASDPITSPCPQERKTFPFPALRSKIQSMYMAITKDIQVTALPDFLPDRSDPDQSRYFWSYTIEIANLGRERVQLISRHWIIIDANGRREEVRGPGVVGEQPVLEPGETFRYASGCPLTTPSGMMQGSYRMVTDEGASFDVEIPAFSLDSPMSHPTLN
jgi:ApaG protein